MLSMDKTHNSDILDEHWLFHTYFSSQRMCTNNGKNIIPDANMEGQYFLNIISPDFFIKLFYLIVS